VRHFNVLIQLFAGSSKIYDSLRNWREGCPACP